MNSHDNDPAFDESTDRPESGARAAGATGDDAAETVADYEPEGDEKPGGLGEDGTIPDDPDGVAAGYTGEKSTFEPEEDEQA